MSTGDGRRWRGLATGAGGMMTGRLVVAACGLVQVPIALASLGTRDFGIWLALVGLVWSLGFLDLGIGPATQNRLTALLALGRGAEAVELVREAAVLLALLVFRENLELMGSRASRGRPVVRVLWESRASR